MTKVFRGLRDLGVCQADVLAWSTNDIPTANITGCWSEQTKQINGNPHKFFFLQATCMDDVNHFGVVLICSSVAWL